eukprot:7560590-Alexandrium_andersonii.AAC.1
MASECECCRTELEVAWEGNTNHSGATGPGRAKCSIVFPMPHARSMTDSRGRRSPPPPNSIMDNGLAVAPRRRVRRGGVAVRAPR